MISLYNNTLYKANCDKCGETVRARTQADNNPEYYTEVYIECHKCNKGHALFKLPVN